MPSKPKRLYIDIETSPNIGLFWSAGYKQNIDYSNIIQERSIICICYKWEGERKVHGLTWDDKQSDKRMLNDIRLVLKEAAEVVGHNGDRFDMAWIRTRCLYHGIDLMPGIKTIDTLKVARSKFRLNSNRLNYIADYLGLGQKNRVDFNLWKDILLHKSEPALKKMVAYCKKDVILLEKVFEKLGAHIEPKVHHGVLNDFERGSCPECGSLDLAKHQLTTTATGMKKMKYRCRGCNKYHTKTYKGE